MASLKDKIAAHLREVEGLDICTAEVAALRESATTYDRAARSRRAKMQEVVNEMLESGAAAAIGLLCLATRPSPLGQVLCAVGGVAGVGHGVVGFDAAFDELEVEEEELAEAKSELEDALDALCRCIKGHLHDLQDQ